MLEQYRSKRNFSKTSEPDAGNPTETTQNLRFVVQKHAASHLHYDFRLEAGGVLKSWAVPKGPSMDPKVKHLAVMVEDHPLDYANFEGTIPVGQYGAGQVIVWDEGAYVPKHDDSTSSPGDVVLQGIDVGKLHFTLFGHKLRGEFVLTRMRGEDSENWLLMKVQDEFATEDSILTKDESVRSAKAMADDGIVSPVEAHSTANLSPMLAVETEGPFDDPEWEFEIKLDGVRALAKKSGDSIALTSRNGNSLGTDVNGVIGALKNHSADSFVLDGELVFFEADGKPSFEQLMKRLRPRDARLSEGQSRPGTIVYCIFDVLSWAGRDCTDQAWTTRRKTLESAQWPGPFLRLVDSYPSQGKRLFENAVALGFEGVMAKKLTSRYEPGRRSSSWRKIKSFLSDEFAVVGFTRGKGSRSESFGSLLLAKPNESGDLQYVGNVGSGFKDEDLDGLSSRLKILRATRPAFIDDIEIEGEPVWVEPQLIAEVKFAQRTDSGRLRFPVFLRMRPDREDVLSVHTATADTRVPDSGRLLDQLEDLGEEGELSMVDSKLKVTHLSKVLWPKSEHEKEITKRDLIRYYIELAPFLLPHLKGRPLSFLRHPDGIAKPGFFQKHPLPGMPEFVERVSIWSDHSEKALEWILCGNLETLVWLGQVGCVEIHPWYSRISPNATKAHSTEFAERESLQDSVLDLPDFIVFDLDPNIGGSSKQLGTARAFDKDAWNRTASVAVALRELLQSIGLESWVKTSGKTGLHVYVPIQRRYHFDQTKSIAETIGRQLESDMPTEVTMVWTVKNRPQGVFIDHNQNVRGKTLACPFSPRVSPGATVSYPIAWRELSESDPTAFNIRSATKLARASGDAWKAILENPQELRFGPEEKAGLK